MRSSELIGDEQRTVNTEKDQEQWNHSCHQQGKIFIVGIGPGDSAYMTERVKEVWKEVNIVAGYKTYIDLVRPYLTDQKIVMNGMRQEIDRCQEVIRLAAEGNSVALVSSGDAGIYGMAGILIECMEQADCLDMQLEVIPGITAANAAASLLGAPLMHDFAVISLSDLLTPWEMIERRVNLAGEGDFVIAIYNPKSKGRTTQIESVQTILLNYRKPDTPVGLVREALRGEDTSVIITTLSEFTSYPIDMLTTVVIGNSHTRKIGSYMVTPRGYKL